MFVSASNMKEELENATLSKFKNNKILIDGLSRNASRLWLKKDI